MLTPLSRHELITVAEAYLGMLYESTSPNSGSDVEIPSKFEDIVSQISLRPAICRFY